MGASEVDAFEVVQRQLQDWLDNSENHSKTGAISPSIPLVERSTAFMAYDRPIHTAGHSRTQREHRFLELYKTADL